MSKESLTDIYQKLLSVQNPEVKKDVKTVTEELQTTNESTHKVTADSASWELFEFLKSKGIETPDLFEVQKYLTRIVNDALAATSKYKLES
jgi:hypothetical protein